MVESMFNPAQAFKEGVWYECPFLIYKSSVEGSNFPGQVPFTFQVIGGHFMTTTYRHHPMEFDFDAPLCDIILASEPKEMGGS